jgi:hypothetical protein
MGVGMARAQVQVEPVYLNLDVGSGALDGKALEGRVSQLLEERIFGGPQGLMGTIRGDPRDAAVLTSGLPGAVGASLSRRLTEEGIARERILFCEFF